MDLSAVRAMVESHIRPLKWLMGLQTWSITVSYSSLSEERAAEVLVQADYRTAHIAIDPTKAMSEDEVVRSLIHELLHVMLGSFNLFRDAATNGMSEDLMATLHPIWTASQEQTVQGFESLLEALNLDGKKLSSKASRLIEGAAYKALGRKKRKSLPKSRR